MKTEWNLVNKLKNNDIKKTSPKIWIGDVLVSDPDVVASEFNTYFSNMARK